MYTYRLCIYMHIRCMYTYTYIGGRYKKVYVYIYVVWCGVQMYGICMVYIREQVGSRYRHKVVCVYKVAVVVVLQWACAYMCMWQVARGRSSQPFQTTFHTKKSVLPFPHHRGRGGHIILHYLQQNTHRIDRHSINSIDEYKAGKREIS